MLVQMRSPKFVKRVLIWVLALVSVSFIFSYGFDSDSFKTQDSVWHAKVKPSSADMFAQKIDDYDWVAARMNFEQSVSSELSRRSTRDRQLNIDDYQRFINDKAYLREAINSALLEKVATDLQLQATLEDLQQMHESNITAFSRNAGRLITESEYKTFMENFSRMPFEQFEAMQADRIRREKVNELIYENIRPSMHEMYEQYVSMSQQMTVNYVSFSQWSHLADSKATTESMKQYFNDNPEEFRKPDEANFNVVAIQYTDILKNVNISEEKKLAYYKKNAKPGNPQFWETGRIEFSQIFFQVPYNSDAARKAEIESRAKKALAEITKDNFVAMVKEYSEDTVTKNTEGRMPALEKGKSSNLGTTATLAIRAMKVDEIELVKTIAGFHILHVRDIIKDGGIPFEKVKSKKDAFIALKSEIAKRKTRDYLDVLSNSWDEVTDLKSLAELVTTKIKDDPDLNPFKVEVQKSGWVEERPRNMSEIGQIYFSEAQQTSFFDLKIGSIAGPLFDTNWGLVAELKENRESHIPKYDDIVDQVRSKANIKLASEVANEKAEEFKKAVEVKVGETVSIKAMDTGTTITATIRDSGTTYTLNADGGTSTALISIDDFFTSKALELGFRPVRSQPASREQARFIFNNMTIPDFKDHSENVSTGTLKISSIGKDESLTGYVVWQVATIDKVKRDLFFKQLPFIVYSMQNMSGQTLAREYLADLRSNADITLARQHLKKEEE